MLEQLVLVDWLRADILIQGFQGMSTRNELRDLAVLNHAGPSSHHVCGDRSELLCSVLSGIDEVNCCLALTVLCVVSQLCCLFSLCVLWVW